MKVAVYPGTFDPITLGHLDIIRRGAHLVDKLVIGVTTNPSKEPMFTVEERLAMVRREVADIRGNIEVVEFDSLLMDFAEAQYISELRSGPAGHFSYRNVAWEMYLALERQHPSLAKYIRATDYTKPIDLLQR